MNTLDHIGGTGVCTILTITQTEHTLKVIQLILTIIIAAFTLLDIFVKWYKKSKSEDSDGGKKITIDEIDELIEKVKEMDGDQNNDRD